MPPAQAQSARSGRLLAARAQALFISGLSAHREHTQTEVAAAIRRAFRANGGIGGCAAEVAAAYGEYPETAARRMRWARAVIQGIDDFRERATATWLTGAAGLLILAAAFAMMACAPPSLVQARPHGAVTQAATVYTSLITHKLVREPGRPGGSGQAAATLGSALAISGNRLHLATRSPHESAASRRSGHRTALFA